MIMCLESKFCGHVVMERDKMRHQHHYEREKFVERICNMLCFNTDKRTLKPRDLKDIPKWKGDSLLNSPIRFLENLTWFLCFDLKECHMCSMIKWAMVDKSRDWYVYMRDRFTNVQKFCLEFLSYYYSKETLENVNEEIRSKRVEWRKESN